MTAPLTDRLKALALRITREERVAGAPAGHLIREAAAEILLLRAQLKRAVGIAYNRGPLCRRCEVEQGLGYCQCEISAYD